MDFEVEYTYTFEDYKQYNRIVGNVLRHSRLRAAIVVVLTVVAAAALYWFRGLFFALVWIVAWGIAMPLGIAMGKRRLKKVWLSGAAMREGGVRYHFTPDAIEMTTPRGSNAYPWASLYRMLETPTHFYPMVSANQGLILPKTLLTQPQQDFIRQKGEKQA